MPWAMPWSTSKANFPFNLMPGPGQSNGSGDQIGALFGIGRSLYFCIPPSQQLLGYWDTVADRLFKIRNSENIQGVVQQLPLFDPPLDPGMIVKAAAGLDNALLASLEKGDAEQLALLRQDHEIQLQQMVQNARFLQWQHAQKTTNGMLKTRASALERYTYYLRLLGLAPDSNTVPSTFNLNRRELTENNFDDAYSALVGEYDLPVATQAYGQLQLAQGSSPSNQSGASGSGQLYLNTNEDAELNQHLPAARDRRWDSNALTVIAESLRPIPDFNGDLHFWGIGAHLLVSGGSVFSALSQIGADVLKTMADNEQDKAFNITASPATPHARRSRL